MAELPLARLLDRSLIGARLRTDPLVHLYELADLDDFFFADCTYWISSDGGSIALLYRASNPPTLLALARRSSPELEAMVRALTPSLPVELYAHLAPGLSHALEDLFVVEPHGMHAKLALPPARRAAPGWLPAGSAACERISPADVESVCAFFRDSYPGSWFAPRMLETRAYFGIREASRWIAVAGVHAL